MQGSTKQVCRGLLKKLWLILASCEFGIVTQFHLQLKVTEGLNPETLKQIDVQLLQKWHVSSKS